MEGIIDEARRSKGALRDFETGTGFAYAKLSEILPAARVARFVRMTKYAARDARSSQVAKRGGLRPRGSPLEFRAGGDAHRIATRSD
jgi:hypothetical protein